MSADLHTRASDRRGDFKDTIPLASKPKPKTPTTVNPQPVARPTFRARLRAATIRVWAFLCGDVG